jgi:multidrug resistance efflux pump
MPVAFSRSMRALGADRFQHSLGTLVGVGIFFAAALGWALLGRVAVYEVSHHARIEVEREVHPVAAPVPGRVIASHLVLGQAVQAGELLVELDAEGPRLQLQEEHARIAAVRHRLEALQEETKTEEAAWPKEQQAARAGVAEARSRQQEAETATRFADQEAQRVRRLSAQGLVPKAELERATAEAEQKKSAAAALAQAVTRLDLELQAKEKSHEARLAKLKSEAVLLEGEADTRTESTRRIEYEISQRRVLAPVAGQVAEIANLRAGSFVKDGDKLAAVVPPGALRAVAQFPPASAVGRIRAGQPSRLRLDGFPWTQYGSVSARVTTVGHEPRDGLIRVEFAVDPRSAPRIPFQHGLPGTIEVTVERVAPATLVLRTIGKRLTAPSSGPAAL